MKTIKECQHEQPRAVGQGYALCDECGALLPDEDPDLYAKAHREINKAAELAFAYGRGPAMEVLDEVKQGQRATDQEIEDDLRDQLANGGC